MALVGRLFQLANESNSLGLSCTSEGLELAGVPLLRQTPAGFEPRSGDELCALTGGAYGTDIDVVSLTRGLDLVAKALNQGDVGRAMVASLHLRLPDLSQVGAESLSRIDDRLAKYDPTEPRDERGRWTTGGGSPVQTPTKNRRNKPTSHKTTARAKAPVHPLQTGLEGLYPRLIHVSNVRATNDNGSEAVCEAVTRQCQITALKEKWSPAEFDSCYEAQDLCTTTLYASRLDPQQSFVIKFPDNSKIEILDGYAKVTHVGGIQLLHPLH